MSNLSFQSIQSKLNEAFSEEGRNIVFWYDEKKEWENKIGLLELHNAEILYSDGNNQFELKYKIEHENPDKNYLIYAPLAKPEPNKNHLLDILLYSREFKADGLSMFADELNIDKKYLPLLAQYGFFFRNTANQDDFKLLNISNYDEYTIPLGMMCCLCNLTTFSVQSFIVNIITNDCIADNKFLKIFAENNITDVFWKYCCDFLCWQEPSPTLEKMLITIYLTYFKRDLYMDLPEAFSPFLAKNSGNVTQVFELLKNNQKYREFADYAAGKLNINSLINELPIDKIVNCSVFMEVDKHIIGWIIDRMMNNDLGVLVKNKPLPLLCDERREKNPNGKFIHDYKMLKNAALLLSTNTENFSCPFDKFVENYTGYYYKLDFYYRHFMENYDKLKDNSQYENLQSLVEHYYTNSFLTKYISAWNKVYLTGVNNTEVNKTRKFYSSFIKPLNKKTVVIISDALRYEVADELSDLLKSDQNCTAKINYMLGELPSVTSLGMAALLPNKSLDITADGKVFCDGKQTDDLAKRQTILQSANENSKCIQYSELTKMKREDIRSLLKNIDILYLYHNQIDSRGESVATENDVFKACRDTIEELYEKIKYLGKNANVYHFIVTADHGFIYKREKINESDKIPDVSRLGSFINRRFIISDKSYRIDGVCTKKIGELFGNNNNHFILFPESVNVFKCSGGQNYVHGGSSPQELIIPVIDIDIEKYAVETRLAEIRLSRASKPKINNLITTLEFLQTEAVSSEVKPETYEIFIADDNSHILSEIQTVTANMTGTESSERLFKLTFNLKNQEYSQARIFYLIIRHKDTSTELSRTEVIVDIAFSGNFGFF